MVMVRLATAGQLEDWKAMFRSHLDCKQTAGIQVQAASLMPGASFLYA